LRADRCLQAASTRENRQSLIEETTKARLTAREAARLERQRKLAETLRQKVEAEERGDDIERAKNWEWTIEENDEWEKKQARKKRRGDYEFHGQFFCQYSLGLQLDSDQYADDVHAARRRYKKDLDLIKPDLEAYNKQKEAALGLAPGALKNFDPTQASSMQVRLASPDISIIRSGLLIRP
jgi:pre-mRNA-splicing factor SYF2